MFSVKYGLCNKYLNDLCENLTKQLGGFCVAIYEFLKKIVGEEQTQHIKNIFWKAPISDVHKEKLFYIMKGTFKSEAVNRRSKRKDLLTNYVSEILALQDFNNSFSIEYPQKPQITLKNNDPKLIAFYLLLYYPDPHNTQWWGRGSTEWTNVSKAVPQYLGHYQPRFPGELGFYDLRIMDNIHRQIELATFYGIYGFCFYYYWFDGERLLNLPFDNFVNDKSITFPFSICWVNESWTRQWGGASEAPLMIQNSSVSSYKEFIKSCTTLFKQPNYIRIDGKPILTIYRPMDIPKPEEVILYWREYVKQKTGLEIYLIASLGNAEEEAKWKEWLNVGFDACSEFSPGPYLDCMKNITPEKDFVCKTFLGTVLDYRDFVENKRYMGRLQGKIFRALSPMWDNTPRKKNKGLILDGATPKLYKKWLMDIINETKQNKVLDDNIIFINAWNEWAEGAYLEPDLKWKYEYLEATAEAIRDCR